jgi:hypothetical protein
MKKALSILFILSFYIGMGQPGAALNFDGSNDFVNLPNVNTPFNVSSVHIKTFQLWFKNTTIQGDHVRIFSTGTANWSTGVWFGYAMSSPYLRFELSDGNLNGVAITGTTAIRGDNQWHQATGVINGAVATLYLDAVLEGTVNISGEGAMNAAMPIHIGNSYDNESDSYFQGAIDELRVWDKALCQAQIMTTLNCELTGTEPGLVAYYQFNQGIASGNNSGITNLPDLTINGNNGTLTNFALTGSASNWISPGSVITGNNCAPFSSPNLSVASTSSILCTGSTATLSVNGANTYTWSTGPISNSIVVNPPVNTSYTVSGTDQNGCTNSAVITQTVADCTGTLEFKTNTKVNVYPNPFAGSFSLIVDEFNTTIEIYNAIGSLIYRTKLDSGTIQIDLGDKEDGIYFVRLISNYGAATKKVVKQQ